MKIKFENVNKQYGNNFAVKDLTLEILDGALHFLLGPSGCGKTTTLRMLAGLEKPTSGKIFFNEKDVTAVDPSHRGVGMVFQNYALWPHMTVYKNIEYGLLLRKLSREEIKNRIDEVLQFTQLGRFIDRLPGQLSGGQQQRVALARALVIKPSVLLLDEPLSNLDAKLRLEMRENISRIHEQTKITTVYVTHDQKEALSMGTHISLMHGGHLIQTGTPKELYHFPNCEFVASFIGETNTIPVSSCKVIKDHTVAVETPIGKLTGIIHDHDVLKNKELCVSIRPEAIKVSFDSQFPSKDNLLQLQVEHLTYLGEIEQFYMRHQNQGLKANIFHPPDHNFNTGSSVKVGINWQDIVVLAKGEPLGPRT